MRFGLDDTQQAIAQLAGEVLTGTAGDSADQAWKALGQAGLLSLSVPAWLGGDGLGVLESAVLLTEVGRQAAAVPALATVALGVIPLARWGTPDQQRGLIGGLAAEGAVLTAAVNEPSNPMPAVPATTATPELAITGTKTGVAYAEQARRILVPVRLAAGRTAIALIDPAGPGVGLTRTPSSSGTPEYSLRLDGAPADGLLDGESVPDLYRLAVAGACAVGAGVLAGALALTAAHVSTRHQFGRPLSTFQAVAQQIADVYLASRTVHLTTLSACWRLGTGRPADAELDVAAYWFTRQAPAALRTCHHLHGGLGLDASYPMHRYSALGKDLVRFLGGAEHRLNRLGGSDVHRSD